MKKKIAVIQRIVFIILWVNIHAVYAQTGIGTNTPNDQAVLDIQSVDKGVLFPSISLTSSTTFLGGVSATASHTNMVLYNTNTTTTTTGLNGAGYYFWNGNNWEKITGKSDDQSLAEVTAIGNITNDVISVGGLLDSGALTVVADSDLQGNVTLGDTYLDDIDLMGRINSDVLFQTGKRVASPTASIAVLYSDELKPGSGNDLSINTNSTSERINFSNDGIITAGVNSSTLFVGDISGPNHYKLPSGAASRSPGQVLTLDSTSEQLYFNSLQNLPTATNDGATLRWDTTGNEWQESTDLRIAPGASSSLWVNQSVLPSSTLLDIGQSGNNFDEVYADQFISSQSSITFGTNNGSNKMYLKFEGDPPGTLVLNERSAMGGTNNTAFGFQTFNTAGVTGNNNVALGFGVLSGSVATGNNNVGVGFSALAVNEADNNVAIGNVSLYQNTGGVENVAVGSESLYANTTGQYNTALGYRSLLQNTIGEDNIAIGKQSMQTNTTGEGNIVIGVDADVASNDLENAIAIGYNATVNASNTIRLGNTDIESIISSGTLTLDGVTYPNITGTQGQVLTVSSTTEKLYFSSIPTLPASFNDGATLRWNLSATEWEATTDFRIAPGTGYSLPNAIWVEQSIIPSSTINLGQSGNEFAQTFTEEVGTSTDVLTFTTNAQSVYLKRNSLNFEMTTVDGPIGTGNKSNVSFGINVLNSTSTSAENNTAIGVNSLVAITGGDNNTAIGNSSLNNLTSGESNVAVGNSALSRLTTASATTAIGHGAGINLLGRNNTAVGYFSMQGATSSSGINNTSVGNTALKSLTTGSNNAAVGKDALHLNTTGSNNIALGYEALYNNITGSGNIALGEGADVTIANLSNAIAIGKDAEVSASNSIQLGNSSIATVTTSGVVSSSGYFDSSLGSLNEMLVVGANSRIISTDLLTIDSTNDRIGIGTSSPQVKLDLVGEASGEAQVRVAQHNNDGDGPDIRFFKSRGTVASPLVVANDDFVGAINAFVYDGSNYLQAGFFGFQADGTDGDTTFGIRTRVSGSLSDRIVIDPSGNPQIFGYQTIENKNDGDFIQFIRDGTTQGRINVTSSGTSYLSPSDYRLKEDFRDFDGLGLVNSIKLYDYKWKSSGTRGYGVKAHELQAVIPYTVLGEKDGEEMQTVDYSKLVPVLTKAIQEQQILIDSLLKKVEQLELKMELEE